MKFKTLIIAIFLTLFYGCSKDSDEKEQEQANTQIISPDYTKPFSLALHNGDVISMQRSKLGFNIENNDKAILFTFFTTWCPPCKVEIPHLVSLQEKFKDNLRIVGILMEEKTKEQIDEFISQNNINYDIAYGEMNYFFAKSIGDIIGIPYSILYYPDGRYAMHYIGLVPEEMLESDINRILL